MSPNPGPRAGVTSRPRPAVPEGGQKREAAEPLFCLLAPLSSGGVRRRGEPCKAVPFKLSHPLLRRFLRAPASMESAALGAEFNILLATDSYKVRDRGGGEEIKLGRGRRRNKGGSPLFSPSPACLALLPRLPSCSLLFPHPTCFPPPRQADLGVGVSGATSVTLSRAGLLQKSGGRG